MSFVHSLCHHHSGLAFATQHKYTEAISAFEKGLALDQSHVNLLVNLGAFIHLSSIYHRSSSHVVVVVVVIPPHTGNTLRFTNRFDFDFDFDSLKRVIHFCFTLFSHSDAVPYYERALKAAPDDSNALVSRDLILQSQNRDRLLCARPLFFSSIMPMFLPT